LNLGFPYPAANVTYELWKFQKLSTGKNYLSAESVFISSKFIFRIVGVRYFNILLKEPSIYYTFLVTHQAINL
jgi:hypothetical protein